MEFSYNTGKENSVETLSIFYLSLIMNTISIMCVAPLLKGKTSTTAMANPSHPSSPPSLGSTGPLGSAPPEGGVCKHPGVLVDLDSQ